MDYQKYPNFHTRFIKGVPIDEVETVSLSDLGLPVDVPPKLAEKMIIARLSKKD